MIGILRRMIRAGSYRIAMRAVRSVPFVGAAVVIGFAGYEIKKKGIVKGIANITLDAIPLIGLTKNTIELFTGDWFPDKPDKEEKLQNKQKIREQTEMI